MKRDFFDRFLIVFKYRISWKSVQWQRSCSMLSDRHDEGNSRFSQFCEKRVKLLTGVYFISEISLSKRSGRYLILTTIVPESMTRTLSESIIVFRRWAIVRTVQSLNFLRIVSCTKVSVLQHQNVLQFIIYTGCARLRENVPNVKVHRSNPKHLYPKLNG